MTEQTVIALGFFDGVHLGHGALLRRTVERAQERGIVPAAFTFDRSPKEFVTGRHVPLLTTAEERAALIRTVYGVERVIIAPFDADMMHMSWQDFVRKLLVGRWHAAHVVAGHDYRFGYRNEGDAERLRTICAAHGIGCDIIPEVSLRGRTVSSTLIRSLIEEGAVDRAAEFLGHTFSISGTVAHGRALGTAVLFPTANLIPDGSRVLPKSGVYATRVTLEDGNQFPAVTNVGTNPTVSEGGAVTIESHIIGYSGSLYGHTLRVAFLRFLRPETKFASTQELHDQIARDIAAVQR